MARLTKDGSLQGQRSSVEFVSKATSKTLVIPAKEFVQIIAKVCYFACICSVLENYGSNCSLVSAILCFFIYLFICGKFNLDAV